MAWFRRRAARSDTPDPGSAGAAGADAITSAAQRFWLRWAQLLPTVSSALGDREPGRVENELCELVADLHPDLHFSLERGQRAIYALVISGQEDPNLRPYTDAWKAAAPEEDPIWEYHDSVPPVPDPREVTVNLAGHRISLADVLVVAQIDDTEAVVDVAVYHPELAELDAPSRSALTFLPLDATLGERLAGERLRRVETAVRKPQNAISLIDLRDLVHHLAEAGSDADSDRAAD
ncbi:MAG TPA: hypothetical protein VHX38_25570 [Pseudonocardiaceae bacterium]|jgi:hypothetical protein|nr:hypothetical protein [Pseudonocardiaceae bacterium]